MKRQLSLLILLGLGLGLTVFVWAENAASPPAAPASASTAGNPWADKEQATALIRSYLERRQLEATFDAGKEYPVFNVPVKMTNASHNLRIIIDVDKQLVYIFLNRYLVAKPDNAGLPKILQRLMEKNWDLNIGKFEWDKTDGEIRFSYTFTTENGIGYESFSAIIDTLLNTGDKLWPELRSLAGN